MAIRNSRQLRWNPRGVCEAYDGSTDFPGAMLSLQNLIPAPHTPFLWASRPASILAVDFNASYKGLVLTTESGLDITTESGQNIILEFPAGATGNLEALEPVGNIVYGIIGNWNFSGKSEPFAYNISTGNFLPISGLTAASLPTTLATSGDWTPPVMQVVGERVVITHAGYPGGSGPFFGWLDISGFKSNTITGNTAGTTSITALSADVLEAGWAPGMTIKSSANDIPPSTTIVRLNRSALDLNTTGNPNGTNTITSIASLTGVVAGASVYIGGAFVGIVLSTSGGNTVVMDRATSVSGTGVGINFTGATSIVISQPATGTNSGVTFTVAGGTAANPLYGAGNTNGAIQLSAVPVSVANFNGRAYYAVPGAGVVFSDSGLPCQVTNGNQALTFNNGLDVTAFGGLPMFQTTGTVLQALVCFQGDADIQQISGDYALNNLSVDNLAIGVGTIAPNTICNTPAGLAFVAPDGLRILNFIGEVSDPLGDNGRGIQMAFLKAINPTRMAAAYNQNVMRISVQNGSALGEPYQEYWYDFTRKIWSGPHTFPASLIVANQLATNHGFVIAPVGVNAKLFTGTVTPGLSDTYVENGKQLAFSWQPVLLPDNESLAMNSVVETTLACAIPVGQTWTVTASDDQGNLLNTVNMAGSNMGGSIWGDFTWGAPSVWGSATPNYFEKQIFWNRPLVTKQMTMQITGNCALGLIVGPVRMRYEVLGYILPVSA